MKTTRLAVLAGATLAGVLLAGCGGDSDDSSADTTQTTTVAPATSAAPAQGGATLESYVATMTPICEEFDAAVNEATAPIFGSEGEPDPAAAQQAVVAIGEAIGTFVTAASGVPVPDEAATIVPAYQTIKAQVDEASATPEASLEFLMADDPRTEVAHTADAIGLQACGTGGTFATISEIPLSQAPADAISLEAFDFGWKGLPATLPAGRVTFTMTNGAEQDHEFLFVPLAPDTDPAEVLTTLTSATQDELDAAFETFAAGPPGGMYVGPGGAVAGETEMQPGAYAVVCFLPDQASGKAHRELGMASVVEVS
jgi:hypothetical protein